MRSFDPDINSKFFKIKRDESKIKSFLENKPSIFISHQPKDYKIALISNADLFLCEITDYSCSLLFFLKKYLFLLKQNNYEYN